MEVAGHAALISGGASGLGRATAAALAAAGAKVALLGKAPQILLEIYCGHSGVCPMLLSGSGKAIGLGYFDDEPAIGVKAA